MRNLTLLLFFTLPFYLFAQSDTQRICHSGPVTLFIDTTWNHNIMEADLILYVEITNKIFITTAGTFSGNVLQVVKGEYTSDQFATNVSLIEFGWTRYKKKTEAIYGSYERKLPYKCFIGLNKIKGEGWDMKDPDTKQNYRFFMSQKNMNAELKKYLNRFIVKKLIPFYLGVTD